MKANPRRAPAKTQRSVFSAFDGSGLGGSRWLSLQRLRSKGPGIPTLRSSLKPDDVFLVRLLLELARVYKVSV